MYTLSTSETIEELTAATYGNLSDARQQYIFSQALHALVRLAKVEQMMEAKLDNVYSDNLIEAVSSRRQTKAILRRIGVRCPPRTGALEMGKKHAASSDK